MTLNEMKEKAKLTNKQIAIILGKDRHTVTRWLKDESKMPEWLKGILAGRKK